MGCYLLMNAYTHFAFRYSSCMLEKITKGLGKMNLSMSRYGLRIGQDCLYTEKTLNFWTFYIFNISFIKCRRIYWTLYQGPGIRASTQYWQLRVFSSWKSVTQGEVLPCLLTSKWLIVTSSYTPPPKKKRNTLFWSSHDPNLGSMTR